MVVSMYALSGTNRDYLNASAASNVCADLPDRLEATVVGWTVESSMSTPVRAGSPSDCPPPVCTGAIGRSAAG